MVSGKTRYSLKISDGLFALHAEGIAAPSGLYRTVNVELDKTLMLNWTWKVDNVLAGADERIRAGNDYSACVYVGFAGGSRFWRTRAIYYVWSNKQPVESIWPNAFTANARMIAVVTGTSPVGQ